MTPSGARSLESGTHVAFDVRAVERLTKMGARNIVRAADNLLLGPSRFDPSEHARARDAWWKLAASWDRLHAEDVRWELPIVVWIAASPAQHVSSWRTCSRLRSLGMLPRDVRVIDVERASTGEPTYDAFGCAESVADRSEEDLRARLARARPVSRARYERAADLWQRYCDPEFARFARTCVRGLTGFPDLTNVWRFVSSFFPRRIATGHLRLSRFDELLLNRLSHEWATPVTVYARGPVEWEHLVCCTGDLFVSERLAQWAAHGTTPAVESSAGPKPETPMLASVYRLTAYGERLRQALASIAEAPSLPVAGAEAYSPGSPWLLRDDGALGR
jgi:hypothetical protein